MWRVHATECVCSAAGSVQRGQQGGPLHARAKEGRFHAAVLVVRGAPAGGSGLVGGVLDAATNLPHA